MIRAGAAYNEGKDKVGTKDANCYIVILIQFIIFNLTKVATHLQLCYFKFY